MYEEYSITGIKQSYRHTRRTRTIFLPMLIACLMIGMVLFYVKGKPPETLGTADGNEIATVNQTVETLESQSIEVATDPVSEDALPIAEPVEESLPATDTEESSSDAPEEKSLETAELGESAAAESLPGPEQETRKTFTPWMAPLALDTYIRAKSSGRGKSFWEDGHWITAVEGRWKNGAREFRISYDKIPEIETWQWRYKVDQSQSEFAKSVREMIDRGYTLVHTQTYRQPDGQHRYQGVWHRELARPTVVEATGATPVTPGIRDTPSPAPPSPSEVRPSMSVPKIHTSVSVPDVTPETSSAPRGLNVNRLNFR